MNAPVLPGYTVTWDRRRNEWVAKSNTTTTVLRGANQRELELARNRVVVKAAGELSQILREAPARGYSPPPRH